MTAQLDEGRRPGVNQTKIQATAPRVDHLPGITTPEVVETFLVVDSGAFAKASAEAIADLQVLLRAVIRKRGGDPEAITWSAEPIGPQVRLAAVDGRRL